MLGSWDTCRVFWNLIHQMRLNNNSLISWLLWNNPLDWIAWWRFSSLMMISMVKHEESCYQDCCSIQGVSLQVGGGAALGLRWLERLFLSQQEPPTKPPYCTHLAPISRPILGWMTSSLTLPPFLAAAKSEKMGKRAGNRRKQGQRHWQKTALLRRHHHLQATLN